MEAGAEGGEAGQAGSPDGDLTQAPSLERLQAFAPFGIVAVVGLWLTRAFWWPGGYVVGFDTYAYSGPNVEVTTRALRDVRLPVINDLIFGGVPHIGNPSAAALYPPNFLAVVLDTNRAMGIVVAAHVVLLGAGMVVLCRRIGLSAIGATVAAVAVMAAGSTLTKTIQYEQILVLAWTPLLLASIHAVLHAPRPWRAVAAMATTTAAVLLAGHPQLVYQTAILAAATTVGFAIGDGRWRRLGYLAGGALLGMCIALPQLVAVLYATADSAITGGRDLDALLSTSLSMERKYLARAVLGTVTDPDPAVFAGSFESIAFLGVIAVALALVGAIVRIVDRTTRAWAMAWSIVAVLAVVWAWGPRTVVFRAAFAALPGFDLARASARWMVVFAIVACVFVGAGVDAVRAGLTRRQVGAVAGAIVVTALAIAIGPLITFDRRSAMIWAATGAVCVVLLALNTVRGRAAHITTVTLIVLAMVELGAMSINSLPQGLRTDVAFTEHRTATTDFLEAQTSGMVVALTDDGVPVEYQVPGLRPNANVLFGIASIDGYDGGVQLTQRWVDALRRFTPDPPEDLPLRNSLALPVEPGPLGRIGVRYVLIDLDRPPEQFVPGWAGPVASDDTFEVWENPKWMGEATAWSAAIVDDDPAETLRENPEAVGGVALVADAADVLQCESEMCEPVALAVDRPHPERIEIATDLDRPTVVSVAAQALPGWTVTVDGESGEVVEVDGLFLGVAVPAGAHEVVFSYRSPWMRATLAISALAVAATIALAIAGTVKRERTPQVAGDTDRYPVNVTSGV